MDKEITVLNEVGTQEGSSSDANKTETDSTQSTDAANELATAAELIVDNETECTESVPTSEDSAIHIPNMSVDASSKDQDLKTEAEEQMEYEPGRDAGKAITLSGMCVVVSCCPYDCGPSKR